MRAVDVKVGQVLGYVKYEGATPRLCTVLQKDVAVTRRSYMHGARTKTTGILIELHETPEGGIKREVGLDSARQLIPRIDAEAGIEYTRKRIAEHRAEEERFARMAAALGDVIGRDEVQSVCAERYGTPGVTVHLSVEGWNKLLRALDDDRALAGLVEETR